MAEKANEPFLGKLGAGVATAVTGGISILLISTVINEPTRNLERTDKGFEQQRVEYLAIAQEISELEQRVTAVAKLVGELGVKIEQGTGDRYTGTQAKLESTTTTVIQGYNNKAHEDIKAEIKEIQAEIKALYVVISLDQN